MNEAYYHSQIRLKQQEIYRIEDELREKKQDLEELYHFKQEHQQQTSEIRHNFEARSQKLNRSMVDSKQVKFLASYAQVMKEMLQEKNKFLDKKEEEQQAVKQAIIRLTDEIERLKNQRMLLNNAVSDLQYDLRKERMKADVSK